MDCSRSQQVALGTGMERNGPAARRRVPRRCALHVLVETSVHLERPRSLGVAFSPCQRGVVGLLVLLCRVDVSTASVAPRRNSAVFPALFPLGLSRQWARGKTVTCVQVRYLGP